MQPITSAAWLRRELGISQDDNTHYNRLYAAIYAASGFISTYAAGRRFLPLQTTRMVDYANQYELPLPADLVQVDTVTDASGNTFVSADFDFQPPERILRLAPAATRGFGYVYKRQNRINVFGVWCYHTDWFSAWRPLNGTTLSTTSATETDLSLEFSGDEFPLVADIGSYIRINTEIMRVERIDFNVAGADTVHVVRGMLNTAPAPFNVGTPVQLFIPTPEIVQLSNLLARWYYERDDAAPSAPPPEFIDMASAWRPPQT